MEDFKNSAEKSMRISKTVVENKLSSNKFKMKVIQQEKVALANVDDKWVWNGPSLKFGKSLPWCHYRLSNDLEEDYNNFSDKLNAVQGAAEHKKEDGNDICSALPQKVEMLCN